jgi:carbamoyltransferase
MIILGIGFLSEASAALVRDGKLVAAVSEERLNRRKLWYGFPEAAISEVLDLAGVTIDEVDCIATHGLTAPLPDPEPFDRKRREIASSHLDEAAKKRMDEFLDRRYAHEAHVFGQRTPNYLHQIESLRRPVKVYAHHHAHAASAFYGSGFDDCMVLTADGWGEDGSHTLYKGKREGTNNLERLAFSPTIDSLGYFYGSITKALGFTPHRHEGKVLGLAAFCQDPKSYPEIRSMIDIDRERKSFVGRMDLGLYVPHYDNMPLLKIAREHSREDIASAAQKTLEEVVCSYVTDLGPAARKLALAGGIFANVKLNERIAELGNVDEIYVFPNMGDGGLSVGAAWLAHHELAGKAPEPAPGMYLGRGIDDEEVGELLSESGLKYRQVNDITVQVAQLLAKGEVVARCTGRREFGPRALGHRSIMYKATDPSVNEWLNKRLRRSEFMPFAPATLADAAPDCYVGLAAAGASSRFMTTTFPCTKKMRQEAPAAVHVDNTARPQVIDAEHAPDFHAILSAYRAETGLSSLINTSFNMHEEPIVCSAEDAVRAFLDGGLPYLAVGNFLVEGTKS